MSEVVTENRLKEIKRGFAAGLNRGDLGLHAEDVKWFISEVERLQNTQDMLTDTLDRRDATIVTLRHEANTLRELASVTSKCAHVAWNHCEDFEVCQVQVCTDWREAFAVTERRSNG